MSDPTWFTSPARPEPPALVAAVHAAQRRWPPVGAGRRAVLFGSLTLQPAGYARTSLGDRPPNSRVHQTAGRTPRPFSPPLAGSSGFGVPSTASPLCPDPGPPSYGLLLARPAQAPLRSRRHPRVARRRRHRRTARGRAWSP